MSCDWFICVRMSFGWSEQSVADGAEATKLGASGVDVDEASVTKCPKGTSAGVFAETEVGRERPRGSRHGSTGCCRRSVEVDEDHPRGLPDGADDLGGVGTDDDGVAIGPRLRSSHAASFGFARSALVHRSSAARGTTIRRLPSRTHGSPARVVRNWRARLYASVLLMPRTAAASSTVRNARSLVCGSAGTDRDTKTSTGECGCVVPSGQGDRGLYIGGSRTPVVTYLTDCFRNTTGRQKAVISEYPQTLQRRR